MQNPINQYVVIDGLSFVNRHRQYYTFFSFDQTTTVFSHFFTKKGLLLLPIVVKN